PEVVHVHNTFPLMSPSVYAPCKQRCIPVVQTLHNFRVACPSANFFRDGAPCEDCTRGLWHGIRHACYRDSQLATATVASMIAVHRARRTWTTLVDRYIVCSEFARNKFIHAGLPADRIHLKPNFVAPDPGHRTHAHDYGLYVGRLSAEK